jgi:hypothetical protein
LKQQAHAPQEINGDLSARMVYSVSNALRFDACKQYRNAALVVELNILIDRFCCS